MGTETGIKDTNRIRTDSSYEYCEYLREEIEQDIKEVLEIVNKNKETKE